VFVADGFMSAELPGGAEAASGDLLRVEVGPVGKTTRRSFALQRRLPSPSALLSCTLPRPLGVVFVPDAAGGVRVASLVAGSAAGRAAGVARLSPDGASTPLPGDLLRACTATVFSFPPGAQLLGELKGTTRTVVLFGADGQSYEKTFAALAQGRVADGPVTLLLERAPPGTPGAAWKPLPVQRAVAPAADGDDDTLPVLAAPLYGDEAETAGMAAVEGDDSDAEAAADAAEREAARRTAAALRVEGPDGPVSAALFATVAILTLFLAAGFLP
jgi:hypothetical protein